MRPSQIVFASRLGFKLLFNANVASQLDRKIGEVKSRGVYLRVFGVPVKIDGDASQGTSYSTHVGTWNSSTAELAVEPTANGGFATVVALLGERLTA